MACLPSSSSRRKLVLRIPGRFVPSLVFASGLLASKAGSCQIDVADGGTWRATSGVLNGYFFVVLLDNQKPCDHYTLSCHPFWLRISFQNSFYEKEGKQFSHEHRVETCCCVDLQSAQLCWLTGGTRYQWITETKVVLSIKRNARVGWNWSQQRLPLPNSANTSVKSDHPERAKKFQSGHFGRIVVCQWFPFIVEFFCVFFIPFTISVGILRAQQNKQLPPCQD